MRRTVVFAALLAFLGFGSAARAQTAPTPPTQEPRLPARAEAPAPTAVPCPINADSIILAGDGLVRSRTAVRQQSRLNILAVGSSSIEGVGASRPDLSFVPLLQSDLRARLPQVAVNVINRGVGGETTFETVNRLQAEIAAHRPDLVIWQLGTNDVLRARPWNDVAADIARGEAILQAANVDVLLIDPQMVWDDGQNDWVKGKVEPLGEAARLIAVEGNRVGYAVQRRFDAMSRWSMARRGVGPDGLHLNDEGYACWASITAEGLAAAVR